MQQKTLTPDEQIEHMLKGLRKEIPDTKCPNGKKVIMLCNNSKCTQALRCGDKQCNSCGKSSHKLCACISIEDILESINERAQECRQYVLKIFDIENQFIISLRKSQQQFVKYISQGYYSAKQHNLIQAIYNSKTYNYIDGSDVQDLCDTLSTKQKNINIVWKDKIDRYSKKLNHYLRYFQIEKIQCFESCSLKNTNLSSWTANIFKIDSNILKQRKSFFKDVSYISQMLNNPKQIKLLFRGSRFGFSAKQFHKYCDNIEDTLTIVQTSHNKTIIGYSHYKWNQCVGTLKDAQRRVFLLLLDLQVKLIPSGDDNLITCSTSQGPWFGSINYPLFTIRDISYYKKRFWVNLSSHQYKQQLKYNSKSSLIYKLQSSFTSEKATYTQYEVFHVVY